MEFIIALPLVIIPVFSLTAGWMVRILQKFLVLAGGSISINHALHSSVSF